MPQRLILASASPRRMDLLRQIGVIPDAIVKPEINEIPLKDETPRLHAVRLAAEKLAAVPDPNAYVLAADTVVAVGRRILPKAVTEAEARLCLKLLSGRRHRAYTAVTLRAPGGKTGARLSNTIVTFTRLEPARIEAYIATNEWAGKAGGYALQGQAAMFVKFLSGSTSGVIGLPLHETANLLIGLGYRW